MERRVAGNVHVRAVDRGIRDEVLLLAPVGVSWRCRQSHGSGSGGGGGGGCAGRLVWGWHGDS